MRNIWKRAAAVVLALAMCLSFAGCYDENMTWAARKDDDTLPIGGYIYYLYSAYTEAPARWTPPPMCWTPRSTGRTLSSGLRTGP